MLQLLSLSRWSCATCRRLCLRRPLLFSTCVLADSYISLFSPSSLSDLMFIIIIVRPSLVFLLGCF